MMPISKPCANPSGFTLIELLVVLSVLALLGAMIAPNIGRKPGFVARGEAVGKLITAMTEARHRARADATPQGIDVAALVANAKWVPAEGFGGDKGPVFFGDGSAIGGNVMRGNEILVRVNWLTGAVG